MDQILPPDEVLYERSKIWATIFKNLEDREEDPNSMTIYEFIQEEDNFSDNEAESISPAEFVDNESEDDRELGLAEMSQTLEAIEKRKQQWKISGIDTVMDSFCLDKIIDKVGSWLGNNTDYFSSQYLDSHRTENKLVNHFEMQKKTYVNHEADQDSSESVNTIQYVLSNRKPRKTKLTTMTIKSYRFSQKLCGIARSEYPRMRKKVIDDKLFPDVTKYTPFKKLDCDIARNLNTTEKKNTQRRLSYNQRNRSLLSRNSDTDDDSKAEPKTHSRRSKKRTKRPIRIETNSSSSNEDTRCESKALNNKKIRKSNGAVKSLSEPVLLRANNNNNNMIVNSTSLKPYDSMVNHKKSFASDCKNVVEILSEPSSSESVEKRKVESDQIVLYNPDIVLYNSESVSVASSVCSVRITGNDISDALGEDMTSKYFGDSKNLVYECHPKSKLVFIPPKLDTVTSSSDDDILDKINENGRVVEVCYDF